VAEGWGPTAANHALDTELALYPWVKLHVGAPGAAGTANPATETTRKQATYAAATGGTATTTGQLQWTSVAATEDYTHLSTWSASTGGTFGMSGTITANPVTLGDTFTINTGDLDWSVALAS
jgi:hypothetical protein